MTRYRFPFCLAPIVIALLFWGCDSGDNSDSAGTVPQTGGQTPITMNVDFEWEKLSGQFVQFYYQPVDSLRDKAPALLKKTEEMYANIIFGLQDYSIDTLYFFCFADLRDLLNGTGQNFTAFHGDSIFYGYGPVYGKQITQLVMNKIGQTKHLFIQEGLPLVFDYSGRNFHDLMYDRVQQDDYFSVEQMVDNDSYEKLDKTERELEAASLCAFLLTQWGPIDYQQKSEFRQVYDSQDDFTTAAKILLGVTIDEIEDRWIDYLPTETDEAISAREKAGDGK